MARALGTLLVVIAVTDLIFPRLQLGVRGEAVECPHDWEPFGKSCYRFVFHPAKLSDEAKSACQADSASLVSVETPAEHTFISSRLKQADLTKNNWYTSGQKSGQDTGRFWWSGTGEAVDPAQSFWISERERNGPGTAIVYKFSGLDYGWGRSRITAKLPYICEIPLSEAHRIFQARRTFQFGSDVDDISLVKRGPSFVMQPHDLVIIGLPKSEYIECAAMGSPQPVYRWRKRIGAEFVDLHADNPRYTFTNGRFSFGDPTEEGEAGDYQCVAENEFGAILSSPARISFGFLRQFLNVHRDVVVAESYQGAVVECGQPDSKPGVKFQWYRDTPDNFVRTNNQKHIFISENGKLYFSEVFKVDEGDYRCLVNLRDVSATTRVSKQLVPSGTSMPIPLVVRESPALEWGPQIHNDFIAIYPKTPLRGQEIRLECFAYGTGPLAYSWTRKDDRLPESVRLQDHNRVLIIPSAQMEDSGQYNCHVARRQSASDSKAVNLKVSARPYFLTPLRDSHVDRGSQFTWRCEAKASPPATYTWLKDGVVLQSVPGDLEVSRNVLVFSRVEDRHQGMYQCQASNIYGTTYSSGQLRALVFQPTFKRHPLSPYTAAALSGNITLSCRPEAAPFPTFQWQHNGRDLGLTPGLANDRFLLDVSGDLIISDVQNRDGGTYTCTATNPEGEASVSTRMEIVRATTIHSRPGPATITVNNTAFLFCRASSARGMDLVYTWYFNGHRIDPENDPYYGWGSGTNEGGLYIRNAQLKHDGDFTCVAQTPLDSSSANARLTVIGPPAEMAGVYVDQLSITQYSMRVKWTVTSDNGRPIMTFIIEAITIFSPEWQVVATDINLLSTIRDDEDKSSFIVEGLKPFVGYRFRVLAVNSVGISAPSEPSEEYFTPGAPPNVPPERVGGGGGAVGLLTMTWEPLAPIDTHGASIGYKVYWRRPNALTWNKAQFKGNVGKYVETVGEDNFYQEYEVKVQAFNEFGPGPNSSVEVIFSAEGMPKAVMAGFDLDVINSSAIEVMWDPLPETREGMRGKVKGYWVNYWIDPELNEMDEDTEVFVHTKPVYGQVDSTTVIGLESGTYYLFTIQVFNSAGLGPISEDEFEETDGLPPLRYPKEVAIHSHGPDSVRVTFRGVTAVDEDEEPVRGYILRYWNYGNTIESATDVDVGLELEGIITNLEKNRMYEMRTLAYSDGGFGKQSPSLLFTLGGQLVLDQTRTELLASSPALVGNAALALCCYCLAYLISHW